MSFFQNTCKPKGIGGKIMVHMMNTGHSSMAEWWRTYINVNLESIVILCNWVDRMNSAKSI